MKVKLNIETWNRKEHFLFFKQMEEPFFGLTTTVDCTKAYDKAKELNVSFFTYYLHKTLVAVNAIENFKYRIIGDEVFIFDQINVSSTIMREDNTFGFSFMEYDSDINVFAKNTSEEIERVRNTPGLLTREFNDPNLIHFSTLPWMNFTSVSHARGFNYPDSCPKFSFGKIMEENGKKTMSISVHVHHGLVDGFHVGQFLQHLQELLS
ncbi:chloramphenicol acetyltransferase [Flavobacterium sp.]|uniref:chloramphenicol acetyltransferase n=1 Tax=Flavobacterium sp. TaxID=239 RepID=UPI0026371FBA|nr:chloramphenicol acetyltransferase [Flavobacterium sp.]